MSYTYLQEQGEESSADSFSAIPASVLSRLNLTADACCCNASGTDACRGSQSGTTYGHSTGDRGGDLSMLCAAGSHAQTFPQQGKAKGLSDQNQDSGKKWPASFAKWDQGTSSWRTRQFSLAGDLEPYLETWPQWGLMLDGECWEQAMSVRHTAGNESGLCLSTPTCVNMGGTQRSAKFMEGRSPCPATLAAQDGGRPNPECGEWLMMWPIGWTDLRPLAMDRYQAWRHSHGER